MQHLAMSGWRRFTLVDPDVLQAVNLVKHPGRRVDLGHLKVDIASEWLSDRNPDCEVTKVPHDIMDLDEHVLDVLAERSDLIISATDNNGAREFINELCVRTVTPMTLGLVHRGGTGGTVMAYRPGVSGCYACLQQVAQKLDGLPADTDYPRTAEEDEMVYGRGIQNYAAAGLSADIAAITSIHAQMTIAELLRLEDAPGSALPPVDVSWIAVQLRSAGTWEWRTTAIDLPKIDDCAFC
jgi:molybdopterin/thiamine biosynthesis adenylyltransferase